VDVIEQVQRSAVAGMDSLLNRKVKANASGYCRQSTDSAVFTTTKSASDLRAPEEIRTPNLLIRSQMLYPLSYGRLLFSCVADESATAEARGFEPPVALKGDNSLAVSPIRPLWHAS
jgi:hypothetical protein